MAHYRRLLKIVIDGPADEHDRELAFWGAATGPDLDRSGRVHVDIDLEAT